MDEKISSLKNNVTWSLTELRVAKKALQNKWVFRIKEEHDGSKKYKARIVLSIVAAEVLHLEQLDVKTVFLHSDIEEDIYMVHPEGFQWRIDVEAPGTAVGTAASSSSSGLLDVRP
ncbi:hypothetical protein AgCh_039547 [Apium graveolens]